MSFDQVTISAAKRFNAAMEESQRLREKKDIHRMVLYGCDGVPPASMSLQEKEKVTRDLVQTNTTIKVRDKEMVKLVEKIAKS
ncbi:hypothetical protein CEP53_003249 [Fusarium sp. AF-6]|nr:hypothetical protein CEP53_003249 [Fusarium sp. AF-6]